jgi:hypothetical protein
MARNVWGRYAKVTELRAGTRGKNKRGTCLHKADKIRTKKPKRQNVPGYAPQVSSMQFGKVR